jgi:hypothetical protein
VLWSAWSALYRVVEAAPAVVTNLTKSLFFIAIPRYDLGEGA